MPCPSVLAEDKSQWEMKKKGREKKIDARAKKKKGKKNKKDAG